jgi:2-hydroxychromene-2-carboxylate isomerase
MYEALYEAQKHLSDARMLNVAEGLGLARAELEQAWTTHKFIARVKEDFVSGIASGVTGTPSFFINGVRHEGGWDELALSHAIESALR